MLESLTFVAVIVIVLWAAGMILYFYVSRQQKKLSRDIEALRELLDEVEEADEE